MEEKSEPNNPDPDFSHSMERDDNATVNRLIEYLRAEINRIEDEATRPGWTIWAIFGAMATAIWLLFSTLETNPALTQATFLVFLLLSLAVDFLYLFKSILDPGYAISGQDLRFFKSNRQFSHDRLFMILVILRSAILLEIFHSLPINIHWVFGSAITTYLVAVIFVNGLILCLSVCHVPFPTKFGGKVSVLSLLIQLTILIPPFLGVLGLIRLLSDGRIVASVTDWRIGSLFVVISILSMMSCRFEKLPYLLQLLRDIEKKLSLGQISCKVAAKQIDLALTGLTLSDVLQPAISLTVRQFGELQEIRASLLSEVECLETELDQYAGQIEEDRRTIILALLNSISGRLDSSHFKLKDIDQSVSRFWKKAEWMGSISPESVDQILELSNEISDLLGHANEATTSLRLRIDKIESAVGVTNPGNKSSKADGNET